MNLLKKNYICFFVFTLICSSIILFTAVYKFENNTVKNHLSFNLKAIEQILNEISANIKNEDFTSENSFKLNLKHGLLTGGLQNSFKLSVDKVKDFYIGDVFSHKNTFYFHIVKKINDDYFFKRMEFLFSDNKVIDNKNFSVFIFQNGKRFNLSKNIIEQDNAIYVKTELPWKVGITYKRYVMNLFDYYYVIAVILLISFLYYFVSERFIFRKFKNANSKLKNILGPNYGSLSLDDINDNIEIIKDRIIGYKRELESSQNQILAFSGQLNLYSKEIEFANNMMEELDCMKSNFLSTISHELRTPLVVILGYNELFLNNKLGEVTPEQKKALLSIRRNLDKFKRLVDNMVDYSQLIRNSVVLNIKENYIDKILDECIEIVKFNHMDANLKIINNVPKYARVLLDKEKIEQFLLHLIFNSIKFTKEEGIIEIGVEKETDSSVYFYVKDNGIGIDKKYIEKIFEHFYQVDQTITKQFSGIGLGLSIVKRIIELHKGEIYVESKVGVGTRFVFSLNKP